MTEKFTGSDWNHPNDCFPVLRFFYVRLRTYAKYASMNEFTCSENSVRIRGRVERTSKAPHAVAKRAMPDHRSS